MTTRKPVLLSDRCGVSSAENSAGSGCGALRSLLSLIARLYRLHGAQDDPGTEKEIAEARQAEALDRGRSRGSLSSFQEGEPRADHGTQLDQSLHPAGRRRALRAGNRAASTRRPRAVRRGRHAGEDGRARRGAVRDYIKTIGLFAPRPRTSSSCRALLDEHGGKVPRTREALEALPGVGRKTANVVLNVAFGEPTIAVDTHIFRVGNRTGMAPGQDAVEVELALNKVVPDKYKLHAHHWLILHGRYTCIARKPLCEKCIINDLCRWPEKIVA